MYHFIYPSKDAYIYELNTNSEKNFGSDESLVLKKDFDGTSLNGVSRVLLHFDVSELSQSIVSGEILTTSKYYLRLYEQKTSELSPTYQLDAFPLSQSWSGGTGHTTQNPNNKDGVSWARTDENFDDTNWSVSVTPVTFNDYNFTFDSASSYFRTFGAESGSRPTTGGGVWYVNEDDVDVYSSGNGYEASQSFSYESPDINMDITDIVNNWLDTSIPNNGLILKWNDTQENSTEYTGDINFFSSNAQSIYSPKIEARWDEHNNDYTGTFEDYGEEFEEGTGTFEYPDIPEINPVTIDGTDDNYMFMIGLRKTYKETEKPRFRIAGRERYQTKTVSTTKSTPSNKLVPHGSGSYSILDVETGETLIPFGEHSLLSTDLKSNYFKLKLDGFINNRSYRILLRLRLNDGRYRIFDDSFNFKVIK